jgi:glycosyltransferase involved in cell wall biosynthesis
MIARDEHTPRLRIALVSFAFGEYSIRLASALAAEVDIGLWLTERQAAPHLALLDPAVYFRPFHKPRMRQPLGQIRAMIGLYRQISRFRPDLIHLQQGYLWLNPLLPFLRRYPLVVTVHDPTPHPGDRPGHKTPQLVADMAYRRATGVIVHNPQMEPRVIDRGVPAERIHTVPHLVLGNRSAAPPPPARESVVLFFGRIWPYKGLEYLIQAEPRITAAVPDARVVIAGSGEDFARYRNLMVHPDRFEVLNEFIDADRVSELFRRAGVVALPYVDATQSGVIPIAYSFGRPVVATRVGGLPSQVDEGVTGLLVPPRDPEALADAIIGLLQDPARRTHLGANGWEKGRTEFSAENVAAGTVAAYRQVIADWAAPQAKNR